MLACWRSSPFRRSSSSSAPGIADLVGGHELGPDRREGVEALAVGAVLVAAHRDVEQRQVAEDVVERPLARDPRGAPADHDAELALVVDAPVGERQLDRPVGADDRRRRLDEAGVGLDVVDRRALVDAALAAHLLLVEAVVHRRGEDLRRPRLRRAQHDLSRVERRPARGGGRHARAEARPSPRSARSSGRAAARARRRGRSRRRRRLGGRDTEAVVVEQHEAHGGECTAGGGSTRFASDAGSRSIAAAPPYPPPMPTISPPAPLGEATTGEVPHPIQDWVDVHGVRPDAGAALLVHGRRAASGSG